MKQEILYGDYSFLRSVLAFLRMKLPLYKTVITLFQKIWHLYYFESDKEALIFHIFVLPNVVRTEKEYSCYRSTLIFCKTKSYFRPDIKLGLIVFQRMKKPQIMFWNQTDSKAMLWTSNYLLAIVIWHDLTRRHKSITMNSDRYFTEHTRNTNSIKFNLLHVT